MPNYSQTAPAAQDWIDYEPTEAALFEALRPELRLIALDHAHHFGAEVAGMTDEIAEAAFPKARAELHRLGAGRVFSDAHLWAKCQKWAAFWAEHFAQRQRPRVHPLYSAEAAALGRVHSAAVRADKADKIAEQAQLLRATGAATIEEIARRLGRGVSSIYRLLKRKIRGGFSLGLFSVPVSIHEAQWEVQKRPNEKTAPSSAAAAPEPPPRPPSEIDRIGELIPDLLRAHWAT